MLIQADPAAALRWWRLPADGVGLVRIEFVIGTLLKVHPMALARWDQLGDRAVRRRIAELTAGYADRTEYFVDGLTGGRGPGSGGGRGSGARPARAGSRPRRPRVHSR